MKVTGAHQLVDPGTGDSGKAKPVRSDGQSTSRVRLEHACLAGDRQVLRDSCRRDWCRLVVDLDGDAIPDVKSSGEREHLLAGIEPGLPESDSLRAMDKCYSEVTS